MQQPGSRRLTQLHRTIHDSVPNLILIHLRVIRCASTANQNQ